MDDVSFLFFCKSLQNKQPAAGDRTWAAGHGRGVLFAPFEASRDAAGCG
jgi:hypothetical protein